MSKLTKRILPVVLAIVLVMGGTGVVNYSFAATEKVADVTTKDEFVAAVNDKTVTTIRVANDIDMTDAGILNVTGKTIDLNQKKVSATNFTLVFEGSDFVIKNGTFDSKGGSYGLFIGDSPTENVTVENVKVLGGVNVYNAKNVVLRNVDVQATNFYAVWCDNGGNVVIENGSYKASDETTALIGMAKKESSLNIYGGNFVAGESELVLKGNYNTPVVHGGLFDVSAKDYVDNTLGFEVNKNGTYSYYGTFDDALQAADENSEIKPVDQDDAKALKATFMYNDKENSKVVVYADADGNVELFGLHQAGFRFIGWKVDDTDKVIEKGGKYKLEKDTVFTAQWEKLTFTKVEAKKPTCTEKGNIEYWYCNEYPDMYFADAKGETHIEAAYTVIDALGHKLTKVEAKKPSKTENGNIEYWCCSVCGKCFKDAKATKEIALKDTVIAAGTGVPQTGDSSEMVPWMLMLVLAAAGIMAVPAYRRKMNK